MEKKFKYALRKTTLGVVSAVVGASLVAGVVGNVQLVTTGFENS